MIKFLFFVLLLSNAGLCNGQDFVFAQEKAATEQKKLLLVFSGSDWCRPCIKFKTTVLDDDEFQKYVSDHIIIFTADLPRNEKLLSTARLEENKKLADQYNRKGAFPYLVLFDANGEIIKQKSGAFNTVEELKAWIGN